MRALGIDIQSGSLCWIILDNSKTKGTHETLPKSKQPLPQSSNEEIDNFIELSKLVYNILRDYKIDKVGIVKATDQASPKRIKMELIAQLASKEAKIPCVLVAPQSIAFAEKGQGFAKELKPIEKLFFAGEQIQPVYLKKASYAAWAVLNA